MHRSIALFTIGSLVVLFSAACGSAANSVETSQQLLHGSQAGQNSNTCLAQSGVTNSNQKKVTICHVPPGNPANAHSITISRHAWPHHQAHHNDYLGPCGCWQHDGHGHGQSGHDGQTDGSDDDGGNNFTPTAGGGAGSTDNGGSTDGGTSSGGGTSSTGAICAATCTVHSDCASGQACNQGCCIDVML